MAKFNKKDFVGALTDANTAIDLNPSNFQLYVDRGMVKTKMGDPAGAKADFAKAIRLNPAAQNQIESQGYTP